MTKIIHYADVQVKNRIKNLYEVTNESLLNIERIIADEKADIVIIAGDLFEYPNPTDSERKLIYNHISRLTTITTLKEIVIIAGNHDLEKEKKQTDLSVGNNPINVFVSIIENLNEESNGSKIRYFRQSGVYESLVDVKINYLVYSLEDEGKIDPTKIDYTKTNICLFHGMIKEYVDKAKLPIRKDIYDNLKSIDEFPTDSLIAAGDIHMQMQIDGLDGQRFIYPGSTIQQTHNEGEFSVIGLNNEFYTNTEPANKFMMRYELSDIDAKLKVSKIKLSDFVSYRTITIGADFVYTTSTEIPGFYLIDAKLTFIKIKSLYKYLKFEKQIFDMFKSCYDDLNLQVEISLEYDKLMTGLNAVTNTAIKEIIDEKHLEKEKLELNGDIDESVNDCHINDSIDDLILTDNQVCKLFDTVLSQSLNNVDNDDVDSKQLKDNISVLFKQQLADLNSTKRYTIKLKNISTNGFMSLEQNDIFLDIPGITRILGTNGIGKTTLYNMIRWCIKGEVFADMSKNTVMKNNLIVFNKNNINEDTVSVKLTMVINDNPIAIVRTVTRKWKTNTSDEQKKAINWKDFVSTLDRSFELIVGDKPNEKTYTGDQAERTMTIWFGDSIDNILFLNGAKLEGLLWTNANDLNEMILKFVGVDYLEKLENNLPLVKDELNNIKKPVLSKEDIRNSITDAKLFIKNNEESFNTVFFEVAELDKKFLEDNNQLKNNYDQLANLGNIPEFIKTKQELQRTTKLQIDNFETKETKELRGNIYKKPLQDLESVQSYKEEISSKQNEINNFQVDLEYKKSSLNTWHLEINEDLKTYFALLSSQIANEKHDIDNAESAYNTLLNKLSLSVTLKKEKLDVNVSEKNKTILDMQKIVFGLTNRLKSIDSELKSGVCSLCGHPLSDNFEVHKVKLLAEKEQLNKDLIEENTRISIFEENLTKIIEYSQQTSVLLNSIKYNDIPKIMEGMLFLKENEESVIHLQTNYDYIQKAKNEVSEKEQELSKVKLYLDEHSSSISELLKLTFKQQSINDKILILDTDTKKLLDLNSELMNLKNEKITLNNALNVIESAYNKELSEYQNNIDKLNKDNQEIIEYNNGVVEHNTKKLYLENDLKGIIIDIENLKLRLEDYNFAVKLIEDRQKSIEELNDLRSTKTNEKNKLSIEKERLNIQLEKAETMYNDYLIYIKNQLIWKVYSKLIKDNFKKIIFEYYRTFLNNTLSILLENISFKLFWNESSELYMITTKNGEIVYQPVQQSSGMEVCFLGLSLVYAIHLLNVKNSVSHIFIDEISGTLNTGKDLTYSAENYQELLVMLLSKFNEKSIFIIDHNISNLYETVCYEVRKTENFGSKYFKL